jgi:hypothetical protein
MRSSTARTARRWALPALVAVSAPFLVGWVVGHGQPRGPYTWVSPPPGEAEGNVPPQSQSFTIPFLASGSKAGAFGTVDLQANLIMSEGAIPEVPGQASVELMVEPLAPEDLGSAPDGRRFVGNAYRFEATYQPRGEPVGELVRAVTLGMVYPDVAHDRRHRVFRSDDGESWEELDTIDTHAQSYVTTGVDRLGVFGVAVPAATASSGESSPALAIALGLLGLVAVLGVVRAVTVRRRPPPHTGGSRRPQPRRPVRTGRTGSLR